MEEELNEELVESTIRRLDADKKARKAAAGRAEEAWPAADDRPDAPRAVDESAIEATIRRIEAEQKAREGVGAEDSDDKPAEAVIEADAQDANDLDGDGTAAPRAVDESAIEATIRRVEEEKRARAAIDADALPEPAETVAAPDDGESASGSGEDAGPPAVDESAIEATIRRIEEEKARRAAEASAGAVSHPSFEDEPAAETNDDAPAAHVVEKARPAPRTARAEPAPVSPEKHEEPARPPAEPAPAVELGSLERIERGLAQTAESLAAILDRLDAILPRIERAVTPAAGHAPQPIRPQPEPAAPDDDGWDDAPVISRMQTGLPPRPAILRDPSPAAATAEHLVAADGDEDEVWDTRPLPEPLPPLQKERRGFDLLPRSYRITVEDRGRSVDLVPLHRALLGMEGVRDMSLLSYNNGVAIVSLETTDELDPDTLRACLVGAMSRRARVEASNNAFVVKLGED